MSDREKEIAVKLNTAMEVLDEADQAYLAGVANGMALANSRKEQESAGSVPAAAEKVG